MDLLETIRRLYEAEITCGVQTVWDAGIEVWIGDKYNGRAGQAHFERNQFDEVSAWLDREAPAVPTVAIRQGLERRLAELVRFFHHVS